LVVVVLARRRVLALTEPIQFFQRSLVTAVVVVVMVPLPDQTVVRVAVPVETTQRTALQLQVRAMMAVMVLRQQTSMVLATLVAAVGLAV
jgi:hypothetical protein